MDARDPVSREEVYGLQMELKQAQYTQSNHSERILRLEKRHAEDAALKSVWNSSFPGVIGGTPQQVLLQTPHSELFEDLDEPGEQLLSSLHLSPAEEEPVRRGATSRANSVRFDESALHGPSLGGQSNRQSAEFGPIRPGSGLMMERSFSHKSDGRHSSAGHSVHSHHSVASGRASSLGMDTNYAAGDDDSSYFDVPEPPASLYVLGSVPAIVRCWLTTNFAHDTLLYADICTGSHKSTADFSLLKELNLLNQVERDLDGVCRAKLTVYLTEAIVTQHNGRNGTCRGSVPSMTVLCDVVGLDQPAHASGRKTMRLFIGSDALRAYSADVLLSQNKMVLYGNERDRLQVPFVRPEDDAIFRHICTTNSAPEKPKLNATATPFVLAGRGAVNSEELADGSPATRCQDDEVHRPASPLSSQIEASPKAQEVEEPSIADRESDKVDSDANGPSCSVKDATSGSEMSRREFLATTSWGTWKSWRQGGGGSVDGLSVGTYQPATRGGRNMKVLRPQKSNPTSARAAHSYEPPPPPPLKHPDGRRKSQASLGGDGVNGGSRWDVRRATSSSVTEHRPLLSGTRDNRLSRTLSRSANPVGVASAFSWMTPASKPARTPAAGGGD